jgi:GT2 family glycosyltransferase
MPSPHGESAGSIVIVTWNSSGPIEACLRSLAECGWERIVVDNASRDDTVARARAVAGASVIANSENRGFAAAANQGVRAARGELVLLLNPDVVAEPGSVAALAAAAAPEDVAAAGGCLLDSGGAVQAGFTVRRFPTLGRMLAEVLLLNRLFPGNPWNRGYRCLDLDYEQSADVEQPAGACLLLKRRAWEELGGFDEQFHPLWFEDVDFCRRVRASGRRIRYERRARFRHAGAHSVARLAARERQLFWYRNLLRYFRKHHGVLAVAVLRVAILFGMLLRILATAFGLEGEPRAFAAVLHECLFGIPPAEAKPPTATGVRA